MSQPNFANSNDEPIVFNAGEDFTALPIEDRLTLTLITDGKAILKINKKEVVAIAPCILLSSPCDMIVPVEDSQFTAKSFSFRPTFVNKSLTFKNIRKNDFNEIADEHDYKLLSPFFSRSELYGGVIKPLPQACLRIFELFDPAYRESKIKDKIKNGGHRLHRVRRYLLNILFLLEDVRIQESSNFSDESDESVTEIVLEYIHANYSNEMSLDSLCRLVYVNRTTLTRKIKERTGRSPIDYLLHHRLSIACELLTHTALSISKIAETTGFRYESYFTRQFVTKVGMTPTQYRLSDGYETLNTEESRIIDEF